MRFANVKNLLLPSLLLFGASCGSVKGEEQETFEAPVNASTSGTVAEGGTLALTGTLVTADKDTPAGELVYTVEALPADGKVMRDGVELAVGDTFTQKDVNDGKLSYVHDGAEKTKDAFTWSLTDGHSEIEATAYDITVTPVNDIPLIVNNPLTEIAEGGTAALSETKLLVSDIETPSPTTLTFTLVAVSHGELQKKVGDAPFVAMAPNDTFTQQDITDGNLQFKDSGVDDANLAAGQSTTASFSWRVTDADGGVNPSATSSNVTSFTVTPVDDAPTINWVAQRCHVANTAINANPVMSLVDPDTATSAYQICVVTIGNATSITYPTGSTVGVTTSFAPTLKNGSTVLAVNSCVPANALSALTIQSAGNEDGGYVTWKLMKGSVQVGLNHSMSFPMSTPPCP